MAPAVARRVSVVMVSNTFLPYSSFQMSQRSNQSICQGPIYCGDGCSSNCDAHAECGQYAESPGEECPLNVW